MDPDSNDYNIAKLSFEGNLASFSLSRHSLEFDSNLSFPTGTTELLSSPSNLNFYY